ncbi:uncharacterized protein LOC120352219 [Nilaparvata lugens]|uniref:uncharacterized protein LOC120352219 n=1 Tax=Nilaparvata lugens TaxID=108931 RepID=UPI00193E525F|nr:uncharacterized protein LOC120352219 [Nilaparvata lugens]
MRLSIMKKYLWTRNLRSANASLCSPCEKCKTDNFKQLVKAIRNKELRVVVQNNIPPYVIFMNQGHSAQLTGYLGELWKMVEEAYDFRSVYQLINYTQGCEILSSGKADIMLSPVAITTSELDQFHFALTYTSSYYQLYVKNQGARANSHFYVYTWDSGLWCAFLLTLIVMTIFIWLISIFRERNDLESVGLMSQSLHELAADLKVNLDTRATSLSISNSFFCVLGAVTLQG